MSRLQRIAFALVMIAVLIAGPLGCSKPEPKDPGTGVVTPPPPPPKPKSPITGLEYETSVPLTAVMIENHKDARPQSGLIYADLVYEAQAEGGITRFMALYHSKSPSIMGPVRSARPYFVQWAHEWGAAYAHCGGSTDGLAKIKSLGMIDLDDMSGPGFYRDNSRSSPHNLYTSMDRLKQRIADRKPSEPAARWQFGAWADTPSKGLTIDFGYKYTVAYAYKDHSYVRSMNGAEHKDRETGKVIAPSNIIVQYVKSQIIDKELRLKMDTIGSGKAIFLVAGKYSEGTWSKADEASPTKFALADGTGLTVATGQTWIEVVPVTATVAEVK